MPDISLRFDGLNLTAINSTTGTVVKNWISVSGNPGYQASTFEAFSNIGPIPQGNWSIKTGNVVDFDELPSWRQYLSETGAVGPAGGPSSWGNTFVRIESEGATETYGRSGFHIHGGDTAGSAGCIDLVGGNDDFFSFIRQFEGKIALTVDYSANDNLLKSARHPLLSLDPVLIENLSHNEKMDLLINGVNAENASVVLDKLKGHVGQCFPAGTRIRLFSGEQLAIEDIDVGVRVAAFDHSDRGGFGPLEPARVVRLLPSVTQEWLKVKVVPVAGGTELAFTVTPGHHFLNEQRSFEEIQSIIARGGRIVTWDGKLCEASAERIVYGAETAYLYEEAEVVRYATQGSLACQPWVEKGWKTYNFEVEGIHTYIANGIRVHNKSILDHLPDNAA